MFCQKCGSQVEEGTKFCCKCGAKLTALSENNKGNKKTKLLIIIVAIVIAITTGIVLIGVSTAFTDKKDSYKKDSETKSEKKSKADRRFEEDEDENEAEEKETYTDIDEAEELLLQNNELTEQINQERIAAYERFLNGEEAVNIEGNVYYLNDFAKEICIENEYSIDNESAMQDTLKYALIDCGLDGKQELAVQIMDFSMDECGKGFVITYNDGSLVCIETWDSAHRYYHDITYSGIKTSNEISAGGASYNFYTKLIIFENVSKLLYTEEICNMIPQDGYWLYLEGRGIEYKELEKLAYFYVQEGNSQCISDVYTIYTINNKDYYIPSSDEKWEQYLVDNGFRSYTENAVQEIIDAYAISVIGDEEKAKEILLCEKEVKWKEKKGTIMSTGIDWIDDSYIEF